MSLVNSLINKSYKRPRNKLSLVTENVIETDKEELN